TRDGQRGPARLGSGPLRAAHRTIPDVGRRASDEKEGARAAGSARSGDVRCAQLSRRPVRSLGRIVGDPSSLLAVTSLTHRRWLFGVALPATALGVLMGLA